MIEDKDYPFHFTEDGLLNLVIKTALESTDEVRVGVVIANGGNVLVTAINELPRGVHKTNERVSEESKLGYTIHAELNAIAKAAREGITIADTTMYVTGKGMCRHCALSVIQTGISKVVMPPPDDIGSWKDSTHEAIVLLQEAGVEVEITDRLRGTSHGLNNGEKWVRGFG